MHKGAALPLRRELRLLSLRTLPSIYGLVLIDAIASGRISFEILLTYALTRGTHGEPRASIVSPDEQVNFTVTHGVARRSHSRLSL